MFVLATIVEGHGDVPALPVLLRRLRPEWHVPPSTRLPRTKLLDATANKPRVEVLHKQLQLAASNIRERGDSGAILLVQDADDGCAATLGPMLRDAMSGLTAYRCEAVFVVREFEAWFLAGGCVPWDGDPELVRDAKKRIRDDRGVYAETVDQPKLAAQLDIDQAQRRSRSFRQLQTALSRLAPEPGSAESRV